MASLILGVAGAGLGFLAGGPAGARLGFSVGAAIGGMLQPSGPGITRGKLDDLRVSGSSYGTMIPIVYGQARVGGNLIWSPGLTEHHTSSGGKGGGPTVNTYTYTCSFAVSICRGPIAGISKIWGEDLVIYDASQNPKTKATVTIYLGDEAQTPDPLISSFELAGSTPAYRGQAYVVFQDLDLTPWGNRLPALSFELSAPGTAWTVGSIVEDVASQCGLVAGTDIDASSATDTVLGYVIPYQEAAADGVSDLLTSFATDLVEIDGMIRVAKRGTSAITTVNQADLGAHTSKGGKDNPETRLTTTRAQDLELPVRVDFTYMPPSRSYQASVATAIRYGVTTVTQPVTMDTGIVTDDDTARQIAERVLYTDWLERTVYEFALPPSYLSVAPGGVLALPVNGSTERVRLFTVDVGLWGEIKCKAVPDDDGNGIIGQPTGTGSGASITPPGVQQVIPTSWFAWSGVALVASDDESPHFYVAGTGAAGWSGATIYYSPDGGTTWIDCGSLTAPSVIGTATSALAAYGGAANSWDTTDTVGVTLTESTDTLSSTSQTDVLNSVDNSAMLGPEVIGFAAATAGTPPAYTLSTILRGRQNSPMTGHANGEMFVVLSDAVAMIKVPDALAGQAIQVKVVSPGQSLSSVSAQTITVGVNTPPYVSSSDYPTWRRNFATMGV